MMMILFDLLNISYFYIFQNADPGPAPTDKKKRSFQ